MRRILLFLFIGLVGLSCFGQTISSGTRHSLFLCNTGLPLSTGDNTYGQLGDSTVTLFRSAPGDVLTLAGITAVSAGFTHSLFLKSDSTAWACGDNGGGQLGVTGGNRLTPVQVPGLTGLVAINGAGWHSIFIKSNGTAWTCGEYGPNPWIPKQIPGASGIIAASGGGDVAGFDLLLKNDSTVWGFFDNSYGQLGGTNTYWSSAAQISGLTGIIAVAAGSEHSLFLKKDSTVWVLGSNTHGQLGLGDTINRNVPTQIPGLSGIIALEGGTAHSAFIKSDGTAWACGQNNYGQLGDGSYTDRTVPVQVFGITTAAAVTCGRDFTIFEMSDGTAVSCGNDADAQCGNGGGPFANSVPLTCDLQTLCSVPTTQASNITFTNVTSNSMTVNWTNGNGSRRIVRVKTTNSFTAPANGTDYVANPVYLGGEQTVYNGTGNTVTVTGLTPHHIYWFRVYEASCSASSSIYFTSAASGNPRQRITTAVPPQSSPNRPELNSASEDGTENYFELSPNPSSGNFKVETSLLNSKLEIFNIVGERIYSEILNEREKDVELKSASAGIYFVKIFDGEKSITKKLIIE